MPWTSVPSSHSQLRWVWGVLHLCPPAPREATCQGQMHHFSTICRVFQLSSKVTEVKENSGLDCTQPHCTVLDCSELGTSSRWPLRVPKREIHNTAILTGS